VDDQRKPLQAAVLFLGAVLVIAGVFGAAFFLYPLQRQPRLVKRNYRMLANIAGQVDGQIGALSLAVKTTQGDGGDTCQPSKVLKCLDAADLPDRLRRVLNERDRTADQAYLAEEDGDLNLYFLPPVTRESGRNYRKSNLGKFLETVLGPYGYFDTFLLASAEEGTVLYQYDLCGEPARYGDQPGAQGCEPDGAPHRLRFAGKHESPYRGR
jgi:hypothetical protein